MPGNLNLSSGQATAPNDEPRKSIQEAFVRRCGFWSDSWEQVLTFAPGFTSVYTGVSGLALEKSDLDLKTLELVYLGTSASVLHMHPNGIIGHAEKAIEAGATPDEIVATLTLVGTIGLRGYALAVEVVNSITPGSADPEPLDADRNERLHDRYREVFGADDPSAVAMIRSDPDYVAAFLEWASLARVSGILDTKTVLLTSIALSTSVVHMDRQTSEREIRAALAFGVTPSEILDICKVTSVIGAHSLTVGIPLISHLLEENSDPEHWRRGPDDYQPNEQQQE